MDTRCAACGLTGHRYGTNDGDRHDPQACINMLRDQIARLQHGDTYQQGWSDAIAAATDAWNTHG